MAILPILIYGAPQLRQKARPVTVVDGPVQRLIDDMVETMYAAPGVGLAANQVGVLQRIIVVNPTEKQDPEGLQAIINPEIVLAEGEVVAEEGCLSIPDVREDVARFRRVVVKGIGRDEKPLEVEAAELASRVLQHEIDHLDGVLFVDRLSPAKKTLLKRQLKKRFLGTA
ncbi:MAG TPA: peptide deformylase [Candidatus Sulfotelmatobacter sp.]|nr:peptide deformylase [Candidatus Sulfotelmatobacter sp.]